MYWPFANLSTPHRKNRLCPSAAFFVKYSTDRPKTWTVKWLKVFVFNNWTFVYKTLSIALQKLSQICWICEGGRSLRTSTSNFDFEESEHFMCIYGWIRVSDMGDFYSWRPYSDQSHSRHDLKAQLTHRWLAAACQCSNNRKPSTWKSGTNTVTSVNDFHRDLLTPYVYPPYRSTCFCTLSVIRMLYLFKLHMVPTYFSFKTLTVPILRSSIACHFSILNSAKKNVRGVVISNYHRGSVLSFIHQWCGASHRYFYVPDAMFTSTIEVAQSPWVLRPACQCDHRNYHSIATFY